MTLQVHPIPSLVQPSILSHPQIPKPIPQGPLSLQCGPLPLIPQPTYLFALFARDPCPPVHGTEELESQFVEQGALGADVLPIEEGQDGLFRGVVMLLHVHGQVAGEGHEVASQEQAGSTRLWSASQEAHRLDPPHTGPREPDPVSLRATQASGS